MVQLFAIFSRTYYQSNFISFKLRKFVERVPLHKLIGLHLAGSMFFAGVVIPGITSLVSVTAISSIKVNPVLAYETTTQPAYIWPLATIQFSQSFTVYHPGVDLVAPISEPVIAISNGVVEDVIDSTVGYGKHVLIRHDSGYISLYAHLASQAVKKGETVNQGQLVGYVGVSGFSTGSHLHLEMRTYQGEPVNPIEILPSEKQ